MERERFRALVVQAMEDLPEDIQHRLENVDVVIEDFPSVSQLGKIKLAKGFLLLGLYEGVPLTQRSTNYGMVPPDKVTLFQNNIEAKCGENEPAIQAEVQRVVRHEIGHHFGIGEVRLKQLEDRKNQDRRKPRGNSG
jgi:predicted Zn-dependent protease with MMP-like domain